MGEKQGHPFRGNQHGKGKGGGGTAPGADREFDKKVINSILHDGKRDLVKNPLTEAEWSEMKDRSRPLTQQAAPGPFDTTMGKTNVEKRALKQAVGAAIKRQVGKGTEFMRQKAQPAKTMTEGQRKETTRQAGFGEYTEQERAKLVARAKARRKLTSDINKALEERKKFVGPPEDPFRGFRG